MKTIKIFTVAGMVLLMLFLLLAGSAYYKMEMELTPVVTDISPIGNEKLTIYMVGEPTWPFGPTDCQFDLYVGDKRVVKHSFSIHDDGATASKGNFAITWQEDYVEILVSAGEQADEICTIYFDGVVGWTQTDNVWP